MNERCGVGPIKVLIVGGAVAGTCLLVRLWERFSRDIDSGRVQISMYERAAVVGPGLAWDSTIASECHLCNLPVGALRLSDVFKPTFAQWLVATYPDCFVDNRELAVAYPPRRYFGEYVTAMCQRLGALSNVEIHSGMEAIAVEYRVAPEDKGYRVTFRPAADQSSRATTQVDADCVVLCVGAPRTDGAGPFAHLLHAPNYLPTPWPASSLAHALRDATSVALIGTGLTAVDALKHLEAIRPGLPVVMCSRRGRFNVVASKLRDVSLVTPRAYERSVLTSEKVAGLPQTCSLEDLLELLKREVEAAVPGGRIDWGRLLATDMNGTAELRQHVAAHRASDPARWQLALRAIGEIFPSLWQRLSDGDKAQWRGSIASAVYQNYSNPMPIESAEQVLSMTDRGQVVVRGGLRSIESSDAPGFRVHFGNGSMQPLILGRHSARSARRAETIEVSHCVSCMGVASDIRQDRSALIGQLLAQRLVRADRFGGMDLDPSSFRVKLDDGQPNHGLYAIGHNARGIRYLTSGIGFIRSMAAAVTEDVGRQFRLSGPDF